MRIEKYTDSHRITWNRFVQESKNGTFLFLRDYLEYHRDRFEDESILFYEGDKLVALLPASRHGDTLKSHGGLTYGGIISDRRMHASKMVSVLESLRDFLTENGIRTLLYKPVPHIYHRIPAEEDLYALFLLGARLIRRDISSTVCMADRGPLRKDLRNFRAKQGEQTGISVSKSNDFAEFMKIETEVLASKYKTQPAHTAEEITLLAQRFPENIKLFTAQKDGIILAGTIIYEAITVAHTQYIASTEEGRELFATAHIFSHLLDTEYRNIRYFDFGISTEENGRILNKGLIRNKESWGARATVYDFYQLDME